MLANDGNLARSLGIVDDQVALGGADGEQRGALGPDEERVRVVQPGVELGRLEGARVPEDEYGRLVVYDGEQVAVLVPAEPGTQPSRKKSSTELMGDPGVRIDYRWDNRRFWLSAHNCQVPTPTSQNLELEQQIRIFGAD